MGREWACVVVHGHVQSTAILISAHPGKKHTFDGALKNSSKAVFGVIALYARKRGWGNLEEDEGRILQRKRTQMAASHSDIPIGKSNAPQRTEVGGNVN